MFKIKKYFFNLVKCFSILLFTLLLSASLFACGAPPNSNNPSGGNFDNSTSNPTEQPEWAKTYELPEQKNVKARLLEIYGAEEKLYLLGNTIQRMPCPENNAVMTFNMNYEVSDYVKIVLEDAVKEINEVFLVVNPNYKFAINYNPKQEDFNSKYSIRMNITDNFSSPTVMGTAQVSTGTYLSNFGITLKDTTLDDLRYLMLTFRHEFMHLLGAGDAYNNANADKTTVMQNYNNTSYRYFSSSDVAFIDAYYRNPKNAYSDSYIKNFISTYETNNMHTQSLLFSKVIHYSMQNLSVDNLLKQINDKHYINTQELILGLENGLKIDNTFGTNNIRFEELIYEEQFKPSKTYFGSVDIDSNTYKHGMGIGSESGKFNNLGNGILFATPGGSNRLLIVKTGNFILTLNAVGINLSTDGTYYTMFSTLDISLAYASSIK